MDESVGFDKREGILGGQLRYGAQFEQVHSTSDAYYRSDHVRIPARKLCRPLEIRYLVQASQTAKGRLD